MAETIPCVRCGASFEPRRSTARFCSTACRMAAHRGLSVTEATITPKVSVARVSAATVPVSGHVYSVPSSDLTSRAFCPDDRLILDRMADAPSADDIEALVAARLLRSRLGCWSCGQGGAISADDGCRHVFLSWLACWSAAWCGKDCAMTARRPGSAKRRGEVHRRPAGCGASLVPRAVEKPWRSRISLDGKIRHLGYYTSKELACEAYAEAVRAHLGEHYLTVEAGPAS
jgi:hypothetical protein